MEPSKTTESTSPTGDDARRPKSGFKVLLASRGRRVVAGLLVAFLGGVGAAAFTWAGSAGKSATRKVLARSTAAPLRIRVLRPGTYYSSHSWAPYYVIPKGEIGDPTAMTKRELTSMTTNAGFDKHEWSKANGGVAGSPEIVRLELRGATDEPVTVTGIRTVVVRRDPPVEGWYIVEGGCGAEPVRVAEVDLDAVPAVVGYSVAGSAPSQQLALSVTRTDVELVELQVRTKTSTVSWRAQVFYSGADGDGSVTLDDHGTPWRVTTERMSKGYAFGPPGPNLKRSIVRRPSWDKDGISMC